MREEWKNSSIIPIYKTGDKQEVENYRRISLLNACYKLYSKTFDVFPTVHHSIGYFLEPTLMHTSI